MLDFTHTAQKIIKKLRQNAQFSTDFCELPNGSIRVDLDVLEAEFTPVWDVPPGHSLQYSCPLYNGAPTYIMQDGRPIPSAALTEQGIELLRTLRRHPSTTADNLRDLCLAENGYSYRPGTAVYLIYRDKRPDRVVAALYVSVASNDQDQDEMSAGSVQDVIALSLQPFGRWRVSGPYTLDSLP